MLAGSSLPYRHALVEVVRAAAEKVRVSPVFVHSTAADENSDMMDDELTRLLAEGKTARARQILSQRSGGGTTGPTIAQCSDPGSVARSLGPPLPEPSFAA